MSSIPSSSLLPLGSAVIAGIFTILMFRQYKERRKLHQLIWGTALVGYTMITALEFIAAVISSNQQLFDNVFKFYYLMEAPGISLFGIGTLFLLKYRKLAYSFLIINILLTAGMWATGIFGTWTWNYSSLNGSFDNAPLAVPIAVRYFAIPMNIYGALLLIIGSVYSFLTDRTKFYNLAIAGGAIAQSISGAALGFWNFPLLFYPFELLGTALLFLGFLKSREWVPNALASALRPGTETKIK